MNELIGDFEAGKQMVETIHELLTIQTTQEENAPAAQEEEQMQIEMVPVKHEEEADDAAIEEVPVEEVATEETATDEAAHEQAVDEEATVLPEPEAQQRESPISEQTPEYLPRAEGPPFHATFLDTCAEIVVGKRKASDADSITLEGQPEAKRQRGERLREESEPVDEDEGNFIGLRQGTFILTPPV